MRTILVDADSIVFSAGVSNQTAIQWDEDLWTYHGDFGRARAQLDDKILELQEKLKADRVVLALSDYNEPWRKKVLTTYKSNRKDTPKPILFRPLREYCHEKYHTIQRHGLEGDDVLGILQTVSRPPEPIAGERIICSIDKDMATVPGLHFDWDKDEEVREVSPEEADRMHMMQTLTGDATDGYAGCPGIGPVRAERILQGLSTVEEMWEAVVDAYGRAGLSEEEALAQARVARICRASDYDFKRKKVILWSPIAQSGKTPIQRMR